LVVVAVVDRLARGVRQPIATSMLLSPAVRSVRGKFSWRAFNWFQNFSRRFVAVFQLAEKLRLS
jgi:hypothetical protein